MAIVSQREFRCRITHTTQTYARQITDSKVFSTLHLIEISSTLPLILGLRHASRKFVMQLSSLKSTTTLADRIYKTAKLDQTNVTGPDSMGVTFGLNSSLFIQMHAAGASCDTMVAGHALSVCAHDTRKNKKKSGIHPMLHSAFVVFRANREIHKNCP